jgi:septal ring factor EnvC (AmiA/AmiB activator)
VPAPPTETLVGVLVMRGLSQRLEQDAEALRREQDRVVALAGKITVAARNLAAAGAAQRTEAAALDARIADARAVERTANDAAAAAARAAAADAARAGDLRGLLGRIEADRRAAAASAETEARQKRPTQADAAKADATTPRAVAFAVPAGPGIAAAAGHAPVAHAPVAHAPVAGRLVRAFGAATDAGPAEGLSYATPPGARVVSPCAGQVEFAAPFRSYGRLLIVDCGGGYHLVLAGLHRLDVSVGRSVQAGAPVGVMPGGRPSLYVELRRDGQPVDPAPWLRAKG